MSKSPECINLRVVRSNKRERTITIRKDYDDNSAVFYRSYRMSPEDFRYYTEWANYEDLAYFLKRGDYEEIKWIVPIRK